MRDPLEEQATGVPSSVLSRMGSGLSDELGYIVGRVTGWDQQHG
jgi:hypothetical protein